MARSIIDAKEAFLRAQIRLLAAPLSPSDQWQEFAQEPEEGDLPEKVIEDALQKCMVSVLLLLFGGARS
jgi:hypothetical protein